MPAVELGPSDVEDLWEAAALLHEHGEFWLAGRLIALASVAATTIERELEAES